MICYSGTKPSEKELSWLKNWKSNNIKEYSLLEEKCKKLGSDKINEYYMIDIISDLIWKKGISLFRSNAETITYMIYLDNPSLFIRKNNEVNISDITVSQLLQFAQKNNLKIAV